jgi:hypothetical protein
LLLRSEEFDNASWTKADATIQANVVVAPDGTLTGDKLFENTSNANHVVSQSFSFVSGTTYTLSIYAKAAERTLARLSLPGAVTTSATGNFDLATGVVSATGAGVTSALVTSVGNGWFRCSITVTATNSATGNLTVWLLNPSSPYTGDGYSGVYIWGAQLEAGAFPTSYIPTVASQVTRSGDAASMTGANFSSWYNQSGGTLYSEAAGVDATGGRLLGGFSDGTFNNSFYTVLPETGDAIVVALFYQGSSQGTIATAGGSFVGGTFYKIAQAFQRNDLAVSFSGANVQTDTSALIPTFDRLAIGSAPWSIGSSQVNGTIKKLSYYPKRLTNAQLQALTS